MAGTGRWGQWVWFQEEQIYVGVVNRCGFRRNRWVGLMGGVSGETDGGGGWFQGGSGRAGLEVVECRAFQEGYMRQWIGPMIRV